MPRARIAPSAQPKSRARVSERRRAGRAARTLGTESNSVFGQTTTVERTQSRVAVLTRFLIGKMCRGNRVFRLHHRTRPGKLGKLRIAGNSPAAPATGAAHVRLFARKDQERFKG